MDHNVTVERFRGIGKIWLHGEVAMPRTPYSIHISQRIHESATMTGTSRVPGLNSIDGHIEGTVPYSLIGEEIELELEDGRRWHCFIQSSNGNLVNRSGIK